MVHRLAKVLCIGAVGAMFLGSSAQAASPSSATLSKSKRVVHWSGTFTLSEPSPVGCLGEASDPICDHFMLKVNLGTGAKVRIDLPMPSPTTDLDLYVFAPDGQPAGESGNLVGEPETVQFKLPARFRNKPYEVRVIPFLVAPGTVYKATGRALTLGAKK